MPSPSIVRVLSKRTVAPPPRPRERIPLTCWDAAMLSSNYIQKGLLFHKPASSALQVVDHLATALGDALLHYYPVAGRFATEQHRDERTGAVVGCSVHVDCDGQGVEVLHAVAEGVTMADVAPPDADVPRDLLAQFFPLTDALNYGGREQPLFAVQATDLADGVFIGFAYNHALSDGTAFWDFVNYWASLARARLGLAPAPSMPKPSFERWSPDGGVAGPAVLPCADVSELIERATPLRLRERMLHFSADSLAALKERARDELLAAGDAAGAAALTRFQALSSLLWRCITRARRLAPEKETACRAAINNRARLRPQLPQEYFGNTIYAIGTEPARAGDLLARGHGWAAAAVGRAVAAHTDAAIRARVAEWTTKPMVYTHRFFDTTGTMIGSSPRFDMYGCDFGWGRPLAARSGRANKFDGKTSLYPGREGGGSIDAELTLMPENMVALEQDDEFWAGVTPDAPVPTPHKKA
ncbi:protein ENHANCED PSEUDOMONAS SUSCEPTIBILITY 1-like [Aegilops tauschii subsp. strangulata]|uniref:Acetyltransferase n=1 Tax=Aegilops tauschii subsp. strangulata TaxID=200361 RepID=A0A453QII4_AEGTS|nr:protein ENHANCED PSEUDOMONAS SUSCEPTIBILITY 1-like [Aegilops tauschii subsp. strangulata]